LVCHKIRLFLLASILWSRSGYLVGSVHERSQFLFVLLFCDIIVVHYMLLLLLVVVFLYLKLIVSPHPVYSTSQSTQGNDSDSIGEASSLYLQIVGSSALLPVSLRNCDPGGSTLSRNKRVFDP
jgi:hypothetical protein